MRHKNCLGNSSSRFELYCFSGWKRNQCINKEIVVNIMSLLMQIHTKHLTFLLPGSITWPLVKYSTSFLHLISKTTSTREMMTPPTKTKNTPAMLFKSRRFVFPVFDCFGFGHLLRSSHHLWRILSTKFLSRNCRRTRRCIGRGNLKNSHVYTFSQYLLTADAVAVSQTLTHSTLPSISSYSMVFYGLSPDKSTEIEI